MACVTSSQRHVTTQETSFVLNLKVIFLFAIKNYHTALRANHLIIRVESPLVVSRPILVCTSVPSTEVTLDRVWPSLHFITRPTPQTNCR